MRGASDELYELDNDAHRFLKLTAAQQRQRNRDRRRRKKGIKRTTAMDQKERRRKHMQAINRGKEEVDPYGEEGDKFYLMHREKAREKDCDENGGWACNWRGADYDPVEKNWDRDINHGIHYAGEYDNSLWDDFDD